MLAAGCTGLDALNPICQAGSIGGSIASSGFETVLSGISQWVASGAEWLLGQIGDVLSSTTTVDVGASWFRTHYGQMTALAGVVILPMLLASTLQAVVRQNPGQLVRTFLVQLPLALLLAVVAIQIVILSLSATDAMSDAVAGGSNVDVNSLLTGVTSGLVAAAADPTIASFVLLLISLLIAVAAFVLWLELLIRAAAVYVAVLFLPLALATLVWPAVSHWCRRLVETLAALILSKFVIVATLSLAAGAVSSGTAGTGTHGSGFSSVLAGGALLVMATFVPFAILRMIPAVEAGAVGHLDGLRERGTAAVSRPARTAAGHALHEGLGALGDARMLAQTAEAAAGGGAAAAGGAAVGAGAGAAGAGAAGAGAGEGAEGAGGGTGSGVPMADGDPESQRAYDDAVARGVLPGPKGPKPVLGADRASGTATGTGADDAAAPASASASASVGNGVRDDPTRTPTGPATPEDAWKWEGVPAGRRLIGKVEPGETRYYMDDDGHGPQIRWLPAAWPPGQGPPGTGARVVSGERGSRYRFGPRERGGGLAGWRAGQIVTVAVGLVFGVLVLRWEPNAVGVAAAIGVLVLYGALATVPVAGRTGDEWLPVVVCWGTRRVGVRGAGHLGALRGLRLLRAGWQDMGVVHDRAERTLTAALSLRGRSFALLGADEQDRRVGAWASVLSSLAREGSPVHRVQWVAASFPDDGQGVRSYLAAEAAPDATSACTASYDALLTDMDSHTCAHDVVLALQVRLTRSVEVGCAALAREMGSLVRLLGDADVQVESVLSADALAQQLLRTYEPDASSAGDPPRGPLADGDWRSGGRTCGSTGWSTPPSGWRSGRGSRCAATSWLPSSSARPARPWRS